jgi:hypothetical protein
MPSFLTAVAPFNLNIDWKMGKTSADAIWPEVWMLTTPFTLGSIM